MVHLAVVLHTRRTGSVQAGCRARLHARTVMQTVRARKDVVALLRFVAAGGAGNAVYSLVYLAMAQSGGSVVPSLVASAVSTLAVNETHRRWTFQGPGPPSLRDANLSGAASAVVGTVLTAAVLALADVVAPGASVTTDLVLSWAVTALVGAVSFVHLRWAASSGRAASGLADGLEVDGDAQGGAEDRHPQPEGLLPPHREVVAAELRGGLEGDPLPAPGVLAGAGAPQRQGH